MKRKGVVYPYLVAEIRLKRIQVKKCLLRINYCSIETPGRREWYYEGGTLSRRDWVSVVFESRSKRQ